MRLLSCDRPRTANERRAAKHTCRNRYNQALLALGKDNLPILDSKLLEQRSVAVSVFGLSVCNTRPRLCSG